MGDFVLHMYVHTVYPSSTDVIGLSYSSFGLSTAESVHACERFTSHYFVNVGNCHLTPGSSVQNLIHAQ